jgi:hypothetical protein
VTHFGYAPTQDIPRFLPARGTTAAVSVTPGTVRPGALVTYSGTSFKDHGHWILDGPCPCGCGGLKLRRREADGLHGLVHVSPGSVTRGFQS